MEALRQRIRTIHYCSSYSKKPWSRQQHCQPRKHRQVCRDERGNSAGGSVQNPSYDYSDPVNQFLGQFLPSNRTAEDALANIDFDQPKLTGLSIHELAALVEERLMQSQWFVTGEVDPRLFSDSFTFKDESVATTGIKAYAAGVRKLFDQATSKAEVISVEAQAPQHQIVVTWRLEGKVNLPFRPKIKPYVVTTTLGVDPDNGLIISQLDEFSVPGWDLLLSTLFGDSFGAKPAPSADVLRAAAQSVVRTSEAHGIGTPKD